MMRYKKSKYNHVVKLDDTDEYILTNFVTGSIAKLNAWHMFLYEHIDANDIDEDIKKIYISKGFYVDEELDELSFAKKKIKKNIYSNEEIYLTICTTSYCNLSCVYCFEGRDKENIKMSIDTAENVIRFIENLVKESKAKRLRIWWYGGEPLMASDIIKNMSEKILDIVKRYSLAYVARVITNGTLLTQGMCEMLENAGVTEAQITIDGPTADIHDKTRPFKDGRGSFDIIVKNLSSIKTNISVDILFVLSKSNKDVVGKMKKFVSDLKLKTNNRYNFRISDLLENDENVEYVNSLILASEEKADMYDMKDSNAKKRESFEVCSAQKYYTYIIDASGNLFKCPTCIRKNEYIIGNINDNIMEKINKSPASLEFINSIWAKENGLCDDCEYFAFCAGKCPLQYKKKKCDRDKMKKNLDYVLKKNINKIEMYKAV